MRMERALEQGQIARLNQDHGSREERHCAGQRKKQAAHIGLLFARRRKVDKQRTKNESQIAEPGRH